MATAKQLRAIFAPVLAQHPHLVLHRRWLIRPPIESAIIGLHLDQSASPSNAQMALSVVPLLRFDPPWVLGFKRRFEIEHVIGAPAPNGPDPDWENRPPRIFQDMFAPEYEAALIRNFNAKVPAFFDAVRSFDDVVAWVLSLRGSFFDSAPAELIDGWVAAMRGDFVTAADHLDPYFARVKPPPGWPMSEADKLLLDVQAVLRTNDATAIAAHLHAMEERSIAHYGLQKYWRRTPFPFEGATACAQ